MKKLLLIASCLSVSVRKQLSSCQAKNLNTKLISVLKIAFECPS